MSIPRELSGVCGSHQAGGIVPTRAQNTDTHRTPSSPVVPMRERKNRTCKPPHSTDQVPPLGAVLGLPNAAVWLCEVIQHVATQMGRMPGQVEVGLLQ